MTAITWISTVPGNPTHIGPCSSLVILDDLVFTSGIGPFGSDGRLVASDIRGQVAQTIENLKRALEEVGCSLSDVVKITTWLADLGHYDAYNEVYGEFFSPPYPARSTVTAELIDGLIVMEAMAVRPSHSKVERRGNQRVVAVQRAPKPAATSRASRIRTTGRITITSGTGPFDDDGRLVSTIFREQAQRAIQGIVESVTLGGCAARDIFKLKVWLTDIRLSATLMDVLAEHFSQPYPACTIVTSRLRGFQVEMEAWARSPY